MSDDELEPWLDRPFVQKQVIKELRIRPDFRQITVLSLEKQGIEKIFEMLSGCQQLQALFLHGNHIMTRDLCYIMNVGQSLRKLDLSNNRIYFLPDYSTFYQMVALEFLLLQNNQIVGWQQLECIMGTKDLHVLALMGNPCYKINGYRNYMIESKPSLWVLDEFVVQDFERKEYSDLFPKDVFKANRLNELKRFRPNNPESSKVQTLTAPQDDRLYLQAAEADLVPAFLIHDYQVITRQLQEEHYMLRRRFEYCSPILTIQKTVKAWLVRKRYRSKLILLPKLFNNLFTWYKRYNLVRMMRGLNLTPERLYKIGKVRFL